MFFFSISFRSIYFFFLMFSTKKFVGGEITTAKRRIVCTTYFVFPFFLFTFDYTRQHKKYLREPSRLLMLFIFRSQIGKRFDFYAFRKKHNDIVGESIIISCENSISAVYVNRRFDGSPKINAL
jgi:hypothetical protein